MPVVKRDNLDFAVRSIARFGDTDVFPFPLENHWFYDEPDSVVDLLTNIDAAFEKALADYPIVFVKSLASVGYVGFRAATQIDPIWNAYLLALVLEVAADIENARLSKSNNIVFSYRFLRETEKLTMFDHSLGWSAYQSNALSRAESATFVLSTDITDFYPRVYHHRLENALQQATANKEAVRRILFLLSKIASDTSYGLPVGGNAARLLAELVLNRVDRLLLSHSIDFARFVDDYYIYADSRTEAQSALVFLSEALLIEGLALSRSKTRLMTRAEFKRSSPIAEPTVAESQDESEARRFLKLRLRYDPYSATADADYDALSREIERFDIVGMLAREFNKSRADEILVRQLVKSVRFLEPKVRDQAVESIVQNIEILYPVFPTVVILLRRLLPELEPQQQARIYEAFRELLRSSSHITLVPTNLAFTVRMLAYDPDERTDRLLLEAYNRGRIDMMLKRDVILAMACRQASYWLSPLLQKFSELSPWEQRSILVASYVLGDEGKHWRRSAQRQLSDANRLFLKWVSTKNDGQHWEIPM